MVQMKALLGLQKMKSDGLPVEIIEGLYIGSIGCALNKKTLHNFGITDILCCCDKVKMAFPDVDLVLVPLTIGLHL
jgi:hypothetical protein